MEHEWLKGPMPTKDEIFDELNSRKMKIDK